MVSPSTEGERTRHSAIVMTTVADAIAETINVNVVQWLSADAQAGDVMKLVDADGYTVAEGIADAANLERFYPVHHDVTGLTLSQLSRGKVIVYKAGRKWINSHYA